MNIQSLSKEQLLEILNGVPELQIQLSHLCAKIAKEIEQINRGKTEDLPILRGDDKLFEKLMSIVKMRNDLTSLTLMPKSEEVTTGNPFEDVSNKVRAKLNGGKNKN